MGGLGREATARARGVPLARHLGRIAVVGALAPGRPEGARRGAQGVRTGEDGPQNRFCLRLALIWRKLLTQRALSTIVSCSVLWPNTEDAENRQHWRDFGGISRNTSGAALRIVEDGRRPAAAGYSHPASCAPLGEIGAASGRARHRSCCLVRMDANRQTIGFDACMHFS